MAEENQGRGRILLIDDDGVFGIWVDQVLRRRGGFMVKHVLDPLDGLRRLENGPWDLLIVDIEMPGTTSTGMTNPDTSTDTSPGITSRELLDRARILAPTLPVALVTAHELTDQAVTELRPYATEILHKPMPADDFLSRVGALASGQG
jgi:DNA-binding response OmpR family regulator